nr:MAG TPA: Thermostable DNA ligase [Caudoviricetes sp.]
MDLFDSKNIKPMLIGKEMAPFDDPNYIYELKWDGERCVAYLEPGKPPELRNKRNVRMLGKVPELEQICRQVKKRCILDGELFILKDGRPDFSLIQRRSLMSDRFKIDLDSKHNPATFSAFDVLYYDCQETMLLPLMERKALLAKSITDGPRMAISRYVDGQGTPLFDFAVERELEGIVAKVKDSIYIQGKRTADWIKMKVMMEEDYVVCGYILKSNHMTSIVLGQYRGNNLIYKGHVTMGVSGQAFDIISRHSTLTTAPFIAYPAGHGNDRAIWLSPELVCIVKFMHHTKSGGMRQPVFKGLRFDKTAAECVEK